ncbi:hypothetical protein REPUB_Repub08aG0116200 [Reevesia pubescens]
MIELFGSKVRKYYMDLGQWRWRFLKVFLVAVFGLHHFCHSETAPHYSLVKESTTAPPVSYYDYIIVGGGTAGCPLAATLSNSAKVLVLERGGSPYVNPSKTDKENFFPTLLDLSPNSYAQPFISDDGVYNHRARVLGGGSVINAGFYSHAETEFVKEAGLDDALVNDSYQRVENKVVFKPNVLQWQSAVRDGLLEAGVLPNNGFTYDHINGTKTGATIFDMDGHRHTAADLLEYADPQKINIYLHATVSKIMLTTKEVGSRRRAEGLIFEDPLGVRHTAFLTKDSMSETILSAGGPQLLMLSGIGPANQLEALGIKVVMEQPMVDHGMADNPMNDLFIPSPLPVEVSLISHAGITQFGISLEQFCKDTVMTIWHYHGGCQVGKVVDQEYRVLGVDGLRVIDDSTFKFSPGTNPQATVMMLGR